MTITTPPSHILSDLEAELLDAPLGLAQVLLRLAVTALLAVQLLFDGAHALLQLGDDLAACLDGVLFGFVNTSLKGEESVSDESKWD